MLLLGTRGLREDEPLRFQPVLCAIEGRLHSGLSCAGAMPARARVRTTRTDPKLPATLAVARTTRDFYDEASQHTFRAPSAPACCMYNTCVGETVSYVPVTRAPAAGHVVLAVWPEDADVTLLPRPRGGPAEGVVLPSPMTHWTNAAPLIDQVLRAGSSLLVAGRAPATCASCSFLLADQGAGLVRVEAPRDATSFDVLATSDLDGDGHPEALVYETWANDFGFHVLGNEWKSPIYRFSCGNI